MLQILTVRADFGFEILAAVRKEKVPETYRNADLHMAELTQHNTGFAAGWSQLKGLENLAGLVSGSYNAPGFSNSMNETVRAIGVGTSKTLDGPLYISKSFLSSQHHMVNG